MEGFPSDIANFQEDLAIGQFARPRFRQPMDFRKTMMAEGTVFEVDEDEEDWDLFEDICEENYEEDTYALFQGYTPTDTLMRTMESDGEATNHHFDASQQIGANFDEMEKQMKNVNEEGTLKKLIVKPGNGMKVPERCRIYFHYSMTAEGTYEPFDTSLVRKYPHCADLRFEDLNLVRGLELAIRSMEIREASRFIVHSELAFGVNGCAPRIPPDTKILLIVETLQYIDESRLNTPLYMSADERNALPFEEIFKVSNDLRANGNVEYTSGNFQFAIRKWRRGIQLLEDYPAPNESVCTQRTELLHTLYANLAQAYLRLEKPAQACSACKIGLKLVEGKDSCKLLARFATAKLMLKDYDAALGLVEQGLRIDINHPQLKKLEKEITKEDEAQRRAEKQAQKKLWGGLFRSKSANTSKAQKTLHDDSYKYKKSDSFPSRSGSLVTLVEKNEGKENSELVQKMEEMDISGGAGDGAAKFDLDDLVPEFAYCSAEFRMNNVKDFTVKNLGVVDTLPSVFFDDSDLEEGDDGMMVENVGVEESEAPQEKGEKQDLKEGKLQNKQGMVEQGERNVEEDKENVGIAPT